MISQLFEINIIIINHTTAEYYDQQLIIITQLSINVIRYERKC